MADYKWFDTLWDAARAHAAQGYSDAAANNLTEALSIARAGLAEDPDAWIPRLGMLQMDIDRSSASPQLSADSEAATRELLAYARTPHGADEEPGRRDLLLRTLNSFSMQLEQEQRIHESLALAEEQLALLADGPALRSKVAHARARTAELRLVTGDVGGALELADLLVDDERRDGPNPTEGASGLPTSLRLRARVFASLGREIEARADFASSLEWLRGRMETGRFLLADLDLADGLDEHAAFVEKFGAAGEARASAEEAQQIRAARRTSPRA